MDIDMTPYDPAEVARFQANPDNHGARMRFAIHVEKVCPTHVWPHMFFAHWAASMDERLYYYGRAVAAGEKQLKAEAAGTATRRRDEGEDGLFLRALLGCAAVSAHLGEPVRAGRALARLLELDPDGEISALAESVAREQGVFPAEAAETAAAMRM